MNREMLLESNRIHFEPTLKNISQMASKLFSSSEEPLVDNFPQNGDEMNNINTSIIKTAYDDDGGWKDVQKIFETFNKQVVTPQNSNKNQEQKTVNDSKADYALSKDQTNKLHFKATKSVGTAVEAVHDVECVGMNSNKENIHDSVVQKRSEKISAPLTFQLTNSTQENIVGPVKLSNINTPSSVQIDTSTKDPKQTATLNNQSNRVRQVNVEMFTVTLKNTNTNNRV